MYTSVSKEKTEHMNQITAEARSCLECTLGEQAGQNYFKLAADQPPEDRFLFWVRLEGGRRYQGQPYLGARQGDWKLLQNEYLLLI